MKRRLLATFLSLCLLVGLLPTVALATDEEPGVEPSTVCTCEALCTEGAADETCSVCAEDYTLCTYVAPDEPVCAQLDGCVNGAHAADCPLYVETTDDTQQEQEQKEPAVQPVTSTESTADLLSGTVSSSTSQALEGAEGSDLTWELTDGTLTISGTGAMKDYGYSGRAEVPWYDQKDDITEVVFEDSVTHIGSFAFYQHTALESFEMADSVVSFGAGAFQGCTALTTIPELHANFRDFSTEVFVDAKINTYEVDGANPYYTVKDGILYSKDGTTLVNCPPGKEAVFSRNWLDGVTTIAPYAFRTCRSLTGSLVIPSHITSIGRQAFQNCSSLTGDLTVPNTVTDLDGYYTFAGMSGMTGKLTLESNITEIAGGMFNGSGFTSMEWQGTVTSVDNNAFTGCKFTNFVLPDSLTTVGNYAFRNCVDNGNAFGSLEHLSSIGIHAFGGCHLGTIIISKDAEVATNAFNGATIKSVTYSAPTLTRQAFNDAEVETFTLTNDVTFIGSGNFTNTTSVSASLISVRTIEAYAFDNVTITTDISIPAIADVGKNAFDEAKLENVSYNAKTASYAVFRGATMDSLTLGDNTIEISPYAFQYSKIGGDVLKLGKVEKIGSYAFGYATLPATVIIPETATYYNNHVFFNVKGGKTLLVYGAYNMVPTALTHGSSFETVVITANIADNSSTTYGDNKYAHNRLTSMPAGHIIYMTNGTSRENAEVPNHNGAVGVTNGGTFAPSTNFESGKLATPIKDGSKFDGWYTNSSCSDGNKVTEGTDISNNTTYYAKWTEVSDYDIAEGDEDITLTMTYGETPAFKTATVEVPKEGSILNVESSNEAIIEAKFEDTTVTITAADNLNAGTYTETVYVYAADESTHWINVSLIVNKADSTVNPDEDSVHITATYGETITLTAEVAKAQTNGTALMAAQDEVEFLCGETSLGTALVRYSDDSHTTGTATLTYDTRNGGIPVGTTSTITAVYGGSVNLNGSNTNSIQVTLNKINTSIDITPDRTSLTGGGTVTLTVDKSGLPTGAEVNVTCDNGITPTENADGTWTATLPNSTETYTFTASYAGDENHEGATATRTVSVTRYTSSGGGGGGGSTTYTVSVDAGRNGDVTVSPSRASYGDTVTITVEPDEGYELDELIVTDSDGDEIDVERVSATRYTFEMPRSRVTVEATFVEITEEPDLPTFTDVSEDAYYADAVLWAVENGVTNGTSATTFSPDMAVSRAQMVTFLWRAHGSPKATGANPFTDVSTSDYYYDAVLWAVANGVTNGTSATTFSPDTAVTRSQAVTFQWRAAGSPVVSGSSFGDVAADAYYVNAVTWAVTNGITNGTGGNTFSPDVVVSRAQAVTFLHRELG